LLNNGGGNGAADPGINGVPFGLTIVDGAMGAVAVGALTPGIIGKSIPGIPDGVPFKSAFDVIGVNTLIAINIAVKALITDLFIVNILTYALLISNPINTNSEGYN